LRRVLDVGKGVVIDDVRTYEDPHVILVPALATANMAWVADSLLGLPGLRTIERLAKSGVEAFAIS